MAWRPYDQLIEGELDNTILGKVTGWMRFAGKQDKVTFDLEGDFHRDIRGTKIRLNGIGDETEGDMERFSSLQKGNVGDITAGLEPQDYVSYPYIEWYSEANGRVVLELDPDNVEVVGTPIPARESYPVSREEQMGNMTNFLKDMAEGLSEDQ